MSTFLPETDIENGGWALTKWCNAAHCVVFWKSKKPCTFTGKIHFGVCGMQRYKMEMKYNDKGLSSFEEHTATKVRSLHVREMYSDNGTLSLRLLQYWPMDHCEENTISRRSVCIFVSVVICFLIFTNHASFRDTICSWNILSSSRDSRGAPPLEPPADTWPLDPTGAVPRTPAPPSTCTPHRVLIV